MRKTASRRIVSTKIFIEDNKLLFLFITTLTIGIALGSIITFFIGDKNNEAINILINQYIDENKTLSILSMFIRELFSNGVIIAVLYISGLCVIGVPFICSIPFIKGILCGVIFSYEYYNNGLKGFLCVLCTLAIPTALFLCLISYSYKESFLMSINVSNGIYTAKIRNTDYQCSFFTFTKRYIIFIFFTAIISLISGILTSLFSEIL